MLTPEQLAAMKAAAEEGARLWAAATEGPWVLYDGCSWRRIGSATTETLVIEPEVHRRDGHPDLSFPNGGQDGPDVRLILYARNTDYPAMLAAAVKEIERLHSTATKLAAEFRVAGDEWAAVRLETEIFHKEPTT